MSVIEGLPTEWLGSITEKVVTYLIAKSGNDSIKFQEFLAKIGVTELEDSFKSVYVHAMIEYTKECDDKSLGHLFVLDQVVEKFHEFYTDDIDSIGKFQEDFLKTIASNAFKSKHLTKIFYNQNSIEFRKEIMSFIGFFKAKIKIASPPSTIDIKRKIDDILEKIEELAREMKTEENKFFSIFNKFKQNYSNYLKSTISRIDFHGLSLPGSNRPNEVELDKLFVEPSFFRIHKENELLDTNNSYVRNLISYNANENVSTIVPNAGTTRDYSSYFNDKSSYLDSVIREESENKFNNTENSNLKDVIEINSLLSLGNRIVILGNPGAGKSSLIKYFALSVLNKKFDTIGLTDNTIDIPFIIPLKDYVKFKKDKRGGFVKFLRQHLESDFQLTNISTEFLELVLIQANSLVCFDGLDEIFDRRERREVKNDIENFSYRYVNSKILVTSRYESYNEVYFQNSFFVEFGVDEFDDFRLNEYVDKWFLVDVENEIRRNDRKNQFLKELNTISSELKRNPLLLSLILIIYKFENTLPKSKLEIYENCSNTLIERRDSKEKKLDFVIQIRRKKSLFAELAYWQYSKLSDKKDTHITHSNARTVLVEFLIRSEIIVDHGDAENAADEFMEFAKIRSIYFENDFTHKTFLEYLTAYYIYVNYHFKGKLEERNELILKYIDKSFWSIVIELLLLKIDRQSPDFEVMNDLVSSLIKEKEKNSIAFLIFVFDKFNNLGLRVTKEIINLNIDYCIDHIDKNKKNESEFFEGLCEQILKGSYLEIYENIIKEKLDNLLAENESDAAINKKIENFVILHHEIKLSTGVSLLSNISYDYTNSPYLYLISRYDSILEMTWEEYFYLLNEFTSTFSRNKAKENFSSPFGKKHFLGSSSFNWLFHPLFSHDSIELFKTNHQRLGEAGYSQKFLEKTAKNSLSSNQMSAECKIELAKYPVYRQIIVNTLPSFRVNLVEKKKNKTPFYHHYIYKNGRENLPGLYNNRSSSNYNAKNRPRGNLRN